MKYSFLLLMLITFIFNTSCTSMPGDIRYSESKAEGIKQLSMELGWLSESTMKMGVYKTSKMDKDKAILEVCLYKDTIKVGTNNDSLLINIDGEKTNFKSFDNTSLIEQNESAYGTICFKKRYDVKLSYLKKMVDGKNVWVKVDMNNGSFAEAEFKDGPMLAKRGFAKFLNQINISNGEILNKPIVEK